MSLTHAPWMRLCTCSPHMSVHMPITDRYKCRYTCLLHTIHMSIHMSIHIPARPSPAYSPGTSAPPASLCRTEYGSYQSCAILPLAPPKLPQHTPPTHLNYPTPPSHPSKVCLIPLAHNCRCHSGRNQKWSTPFWATNVNGLLIGIAIMFRESWVAGARRMLYGPRVGHPTSRARPVGS